MLVVRCKLVVNSVVMFVGVFHYLVWIGGFDCALTWLGGVVGSLSSGCRLVWFACRI